MTSAERADPSVDQIMKNRLGCFASWFVVFVLVFCSVRGWLVLNFDIEAEIVYAVSSLLLIATSLQAYNCRGRIRDLALSKLRSLLLINLLFGAVYIFGLYILGGPLDIVPNLYIYLIPYVLFLFIRVPAYKMNLGFLLILVATAFSVASNFLVSLDGPSGLEFLEAYNLRLRPSVFEAMSRTGDYLRVGGYTGSYHDSANILGMLGAFYYTESIVKKNFSSFILGIVALISMALTQSAANIVIVISTCLFFTFYVVFAENKKISIVLVLSSLTFAVLAFLFIPGSLVFLDRIGSDGEWDSMLENVSFGILFSPHFWLGYDFIIGGIPTEAAILKGVFSRGVFFALFTYWVLVYPIYIYGSNKCLNLLPYLAAISFGFLSLLHYGSLFRITSICIFWAMQALFFLQLIDNKRRLSQS